MSLITCVLFNCTARKDIRYFENVSSSGTQDLPLAITIRPYDKIKIDVSSPDNVGVSPFNRTETSYIVDDQAGTSSITTKPYTVDENGYIDFPVLGRISIKGMTTREIQQHLIKQIIDGNYIKFPVVDVQLLNFRISILGEVKSPGVYDFENEKITLLEALAKAGDLTISGKRDNILIIREKPEGQEFIRVSLLDRTVFNSPGYYINQNDVIYVEPSVVGTRKEAWETRIGLFTGVAAFILSMYAILSR